MTTRQKLLGLALTLILITAIVAGTTGVLAQDVTPTPNAPSAPAYSWNMHGMMWDNWQSDTMWTTVANALGIDVNTLFTELQSGTTLAQLAEAHGVDVQTVYDAALTIMTDHMNAMVEAGYISQIQADDRLAWMHDNMAQMPMFSTGGFSPCPMGGMMGSNGSYGMHGGMMGGGMHGGMMGGGMHGGMMGGHHG